MFKVTDNGSFREGYALLAILTDPQFIRECDKAKVEEYAVEIKRELRKWAHRDGAVNVGMGFMVDRRIVAHSGMDGYTELVSIPDDFRTVEDADMFFRDFIWIDFRPSQYDCTGQAFTSWYKLFKRGDRFFAYHRVSYDV